MQRLEGSGAVRHLYGSLGVKGLNMFKTIEEAADCEIRPVIRFLNGRIVLSSEIHHQICQVYGDNAMCDGMVRKWVRMFNEGRENVHDEARSGVHLW